VTFLSLFVLIVIIINWTNYFINLTILSYLCIIFNTNIVFYYIIFLTTIRTKLNKSIVCWYVKIIIFTWDLLDEYFFFINYKVFLTRFNLLITYEHTLWITDLTFARFARENTENKRCLYILLTSNRSDFFLLDSTAEALNNNNNNICAYFFSF